MPKPVLSDSLFNADDVATAVLAEANLQIANSDLGVTDLGNPITLRTGWQFTSGTHQAFYFNGFVFLQYSCFKTSAPSSAETFGDITNSDYYPSYNVQHASVGYGGETAYFISINTSGEMSVHSPTEISGGDATFRIRGNLWYRT